MVTFKKQTQGKMSFGEGECEHDQDLFAKLVLSVLP